MMIVVGREHFSAQNFSSGGHFKVESFAQKHAGSNGPSFLKFSRLTSTSLLIFKGILKAKELLILYAGFAYCI